MKLLSQKRHAIDFLFPVTVFFVFIHLLVSL